MRTIKFRAWLPTIKKSAIEIIGNIHENPGLKEVAENVR